MQCEVVVVGGCGHVGLPLAITLAKLGLRTGIFDSAEQAVDMVNRGVMPFLEEDAEQALQEVVADGLLVASADASVIKGARHVVIVVGTPVDDHMNPDPNVVGRVMEQCRPYLSVIVANIIDGSTNANENRFDCGMFMAVFLCSD